MPSPIPARLTPSPHGSIHLRLVGILRVTSGMVEKTELTNDLLQPNYHTFSN